MDILAQRSYQEETAIAGVDNWIASHGAGGSDRLAVLRIELEGTTRLRSLLGCSSGEKLLRQLHEGVAGALRIDDRVTILSDSELLVTLFGIHNKGHALLAVRKLSQILQSRLQEAATMVSLAPVFGVALWPDAGDNGLELFRHAGIAAERARRERREYVVASPQDDGDSLFAWNIEQEVERALAEDEFELHYQPQVALSSTTPVGVESLIRWHHPEQGLLYPGRFIQQLEQSSAIHAVTRWCLHTALRELGCWAALPCPPGVSVNISSRNFLDPSFREVVANALDLWAVPPQLLTLEITEGALVEDIDYATAVLNALRQLGVRISIDDFGTGYSSLAYLKQLPIDELKIDQSFVLNCLSEPHDRSIVETIIKIARDFGFSIVAEGIEQREVMTLLSELGCDSGQGYAISPPLAHRDLCQWLAATPDASL